MTLSLRARLLVGVIATTLAILASFSLALYYLMRASLLGEVDSSLGAKARAIAALVDFRKEACSARVHLDAVPEPVRSVILRKTAGRKITKIEKKWWDGRVRYEVEVVGDGEEVEFDIPSGEPPPPPRPARIALEFDPSRFPEFQRAERPEYFELWGPGGEVLYRSRSLGAKDLPRENASRGHVLARSTTLPDGRPGRIAWLTFRVGEGRRGGPLEPTVAVAAETAAVDRTLARLLVLLVAVCGGAVVISSALLGWVVRASTRSVDRLAAEISGIGEENLDARLATETVPKELAPIAQRINDLLARLQAAFEREKTFSANVAHELRTPLAGLRSTLEVALGRKRERPALEAALEDSLAISRQMHAMVENLLAMARCEAGRLEVATERVELAEFLRQCWAQFGETARRRNLTVQWHLDDGCTLTTDREKLRLILNNLFDNAVTYADPGGRITIALRREGRGVELRVANTGCTLSEDEIARVFERFWRGDAARTEAGVHCGLGLPLCKRLAQLLGGEITAEAAGGEFAATLTLPTCEDRND